MANGAVRPEPLEGPPGAACAGPAGARRGSGLRPSGRFVRHKRCLKYTRAFTVVGTLLCRPPGGCVETFPRGGRRARGIWGGFFTLLKSDGSRWGWGERGRGPSLPGVRAQAAPGAGGERAAPARGAPGAPPANPAPWRVDSRVAPAPDFCLNNANLRPPWGRYRPRNDRPARKGEAAREPRKHCFPRFKGGNLNDSHPFD